MFRNQILSMVLLVGMLISQSAPSVLAATYCDQARFVSDLTVPDGSSFAPGASFTKTWRLMNIGTCTWNTSYSLIWTGGDSVGSPAPVKLPVVVTPGQIVDLSINLTAPATAGHFKALFKLSNPSGVQFGLGESANDPFWADINVVATNAVIYDFVTNAAYAQWRSGAGVIPFPGTSGDSRGFGYQVNNPHLEDDSLDSAPGLLVVPQNKFNGYIQATYPEFQIQPGDRLQTLVNCEFGATSCYVTFRIDYILPNGVQRTLWSFKEAYDKRFYRADLGLSALAGQKVRFVFMLLSSGFASGDRALWGSPRITRSGTTQPPAPPPTLTPLPPLPATATPIGQPPPTIAPSGCDKAAFVADATVPDGTIFSPGAAFTKTWRLRNSGSCAWTTSYKLVYYSGDILSAPTSVNLPWNVPVNGTVDISVNMVAPTAAGKYRGFWMLANTNGQFFGIGADASKPVWVDINVAGEAPVNTGYDFTANVCSAEWRSTVGVLPCPGTDGNVNGFVIRLDAPKQEDGSTGGPGLLTVPQNRFNGYIQGFYPTLTILPGDKFQATVGCAFGAACYLTYRLDYMTASGYIGTFWTWREQNEGRVFNANIDLTPLAGRSVRFILTILATGSATNDRAIWGSPRILRTGGISTATPTATQTASQTPPSPGDWLKYTNPSYGFEFKYPPQAQIVEQSNTSLKMNLPFIPGTNLIEKYLQLSVNENVNPCQSPLSSTSPPGSPTETVVFNGIPFFKQVGGDAGVGHLREWVGYSTLKGNACISMDFLLHSLGSGNFSTPVPEFDKAAESAVFAQMMGTFGWTPAPVTPISPTVPPAQLPDLSIVQMHIELQNTNCYTSGDLMGVRLWIRNNGQEAAGTFSVNVNGVEQTVNGLGVGETINIFFSGYSHPVTAVVDSTTLIAESDESNNSRSEFLPVPTPPLPCATPPELAQNIVSTLNAKNFDAAKSKMGQSFTMAFWQSQGTSLTPEAAIQQLQVNHIGASTILTPDPNKDLIALLGGLSPYSIVGLDASNSLALFVSGWGLDGKGEAILYVTRRADGSLYWYGVLIAPTGFLPNTAPVSHEAFCADTRVPALIEQLKASMNQSNGDMFGGLVSSTHGVDVRLWAYASAVNFNQITARNVFTSTEFYNWGGGPSGIPDVGSFKEIIQPKLLDVLNAPNRETYCDDLTKVFPLATPWPYPDIRFYNLYKPATSTTAFDFRTWLIGFEYINNQPYLHSMVTIVWEP